MTKIALHIIFCIALAQDALVAAQRQPLEPWDSNHHPTDSLRHHVEVIDASQHSYTIHQGGTMDGVNCRSPVGVGMMDGPPIVQTWESNRTVRMENIGETDIVNPWLSNGHNTYRTLGEIVSSAATPGMTDGEKAHAIWFQEISSRYHWGGDNDELGDPVKLFNVYGYNTCGNDSICLAGLWRAAGLKVSPARVVGHCVTQAYFDGRWNLFDGDMHSMYLLRDNRTIASEEDLVRDHDLIKRSHTQGILNPDKRANDEWEASIYVYPGKPEGDRRSATGTNMNMTLRPGEAITWCWGHVSPLKYHGPDKPRNPDLICNGLWEYRPDFSNELWKKGASEIDNIESKNGELIAAAGKEGSIVWTIRAPYVIVGGQLESEESGAKFSVSFDGKTWTPIEHDLAKVFPPEGKAHYEYRLRCELGQGVNLKRLAVTNDLQMAPLALPAMHVGDNAFVYSDQSQAGRKVRISHEWVERSASQPPLASAAPLYPPDGGDAEGTDFMFRWQGAENPGGAKVADYHFELSDRADMRWPLSTNFYKLISNTSDAGKSQYTLPSGGLLTPDQKYYWRVRAKNAAGMWGPWSSTWSFTPRGPDSPVEVSLAFNPDRTIGTLKWKPSPSGRKPAKYRIYGSDEKGFSVSDQPYTAVVGASKVVSAARDANFITEVTATEALVIGSEVKLPNANRAFYRVVAVDEQGKRSGPSDPVESPRPIFYSIPVSGAKVGSPYRSASAVIRSLGDLHTRVIDGKETMNYWDMEKPRFAISAGPSWLKIDPDTGVLSGTPSHPGKAAVVVTATLQREVRNLDSGALSWGVEKVVSSSPQTIGDATQKFTIEVAP